MTCVGSGFCCKQAPCGFGAWDAERRQCIYLELWEQSETKAPRYRCARYEHISQQPGAHLSPAFGAGCSSTLFNEDRSAILVELRTKHGT
jgi:hypothetical protein